MGRKSLAAVRKEQLLAAWEASLAEFGLAGSTFTRVATRAGMKPSVISHYFGSRQQAETALVERLVAKQRESFAGRVWPCPPKQRLAKILDLLFAEESDAPQAEPAMREIRALASRDAPTRERLHALYREHLRICRDALADAYPGRSGRRYADAAYSLLCLADAHAGLVALGFDAVRATSTRKSAEALLAGLSKKRGVRSGGVRNGRRPKGAATRSGDRPRRNERERAD